MINDYNSDLPVLLSITLFKNNYYDQKIISLIKQKALYYRQEVENKFTVSTYDLKIIIHEDLKDILDITISSTPIEFPKNINSIYFINELLERFSNLRYFIVNVSDSENTSRIMKIKKETNDEIDGEKDVINFDFKIIHSVLNLPNYIKPKQLILLNNFFKQIGIMQLDLFRKGPPYIHIKILDFLDKIDDFYDLVGENSPEILQYKFILDLISNLINPKLRVDNPTCILITDY
jgi:hypothetical protein